jgi:hypothetical protein
MAFSLIRVSGANEGVMDHDLTSKFHVGCGHKVALVSCGMARLEVLRLSGA